MGKVISINVSFPERSLDCVHYSRCLAQAVDLSLSRDHFSCRGCQAYEQEQIGEFEVFLEGERALKLLKAVWQESLRTRRRPVAFSIPSI